MSLRLLLAFIAGGTAACGLCCGGEETSDPGTRFTVPSLDWEARPSRLDNVGLITVGAEGAKVLSSGPPRTGGPALVKQMAVPAGEIALRARGRRIIENGSDLTFYINPTCVVARRLEEEVSLQATASAADRRLADPRPATALPTWLLVAGAVLAVGACAAAVYLAGRRQLPQKAAEAADPNKALPGWPRRGDYLLMALFFVAITIYGSLLPFRYRPLELHETFEHFTQILGRSFLPKSRSNFVANALLFVPLSYCLLAALQTDVRKWTRRMLCVPLVLSVCAGLSFAVEFAQLWFPGRFPSLSDIVAQVIGAVVGVGLWLTVGKPITDWVRSYTGSWRSQDQIDWLLQAYLVGLLIYSVMPLDLTLSPGELYHKFLAGKIALVPFTNLDLGFSSLYELFCDVLIFIPVGMLATTWQTSPERPVRPILTSVLLGGLFVVAIELAQLLVYSRHSTTEDLITGTLGVWVGTWLMRCWRGGVQRGRPQPAFGGAARQTVLWLGLACVYSLFLFVIFCAPFSPIDDPQQIKARFHGFFNTPFASLQCGSEFNAVSQILKKTLFYVPLGAMFAIAIVPLPVPPAIRRILLAGSLIFAAGVAAAIEMAQVFLPPHVPDITDLLLCPVGAALGIVVTVRFLAGQARRS